MLNKITTGIGLTAYQNASHQMAKAGEVLAKASVDSMVEGKKSDLISPLVELQQSSLGTKAAIKLIDVEKNNSEFLLDVMA